VPHAKFRLSKRELSRIVIRLYVKHIYPSSDGVAYSQIDHLFDTRRNPSMIDVPFEVREC
jgi:hypothetical protein